MKTIVLKSTNESLYMFDDSVEIVVTDTEVTIGNPAQLIISDCNSSNALVYEGVTQPDGWVGWKYLFDGADWSLNPEYVPPRQIPQE